MLSAMHEAHRPDGMTRPVGVVVGIVRPQAKRRVTDAVAQIDQTAKPDCLLDPAQH
jgi:hypothetical protein